MGSTLNRQPSQGGGDSSFERRGLDVVGSPALRRWPLRTSPVEIL